MFIIYLFVLFASASVREDEKSNWRKRAGNHESWLDDYESVKRQMQGMGVRILAGTSIAIGNNVTISGIDDPGFMKEFRADSTAIIEEQLKDIIVDTDKYNILLSHRPEAINEYADKQFDFVLWRCNFFTACSY